MSQLLSPDSARRARPVPLPVLTQSHPDAQRRLRCSPLAALIVLAFTQGDAYAATDGERIAALEQHIVELEAKLNALLATTPTAINEPNAAQATRVDTLEQNLLVVQRKLEIKEEEAITALPKTAVLTASDKGFALASRDSRYNLKLRGLLHVDVRDFLNDGTLPAGVDGTLIRRARPILEGTLAGIYDFRLMPDFAGNKSVLQDAYIEARLHPAAKVRVGKFKTPFGLERLQSINDARYVELGLPTNLVPNRDLGLQLSGDVLGGTLNYAIGVFNGVLDGGSSDANNDLENNGDKDWAARLFAQPFLNGDNFYLRGLGLGIAATYVDQRGTASAPVLPSYRSPGQQSVFSYRSGASGTFSDGKRLRWSPQLQYYAGRWGLLGEYVAVEQEVSRVSVGARRHDTLKQQAWQLEFNYVLTGEDASYKGINPRAAFEPDSGNWGAWELVSRIGELDVDNAAFSAGAASFADPTIAISEQRAWNLGLNWYLNRNLKWSFDYEQTHFKGGSVASADRANEKIAFSRFQLAF